MGKTDLAVAPYRRVGSIDLPQCNGAPPWGEDIRVGCRARYRNMNKHIGNGPVETAYTQHYTTQEIRTRHCTRIIRSIDPPHLHLLCVARGTPRRPTL